MNQMILHTLFLDNPELDIAIERFCRSDPGYVQAQSEFEQIAREVESVLGYEGYCTFEERLNSYMAKENRACYLFGLGLREEVLNSFRGAVQASPAGGKLARRKP